MTAEPPRLVLASTSRYRRDLLARLGLDFLTEAPGVEETPRDEEPPLDLAERLAREKARAVFARHGAAVVIGSDQVADLDGRALGKPGTPERAFEQLRDCSGREVTFHTAVCVAGPQREVAFVDRTVVHFRVLSNDEIHRYLARDTPYDCAGSFKSEGLGAVLFKAISNDDPTALVGLPLIALARTLREFGYRLP